MNNRCLIMTSLFGAFLECSSLFAEEIEGQVTLVGSAFNSRPVLTVDGKASQVILCSDQNEKPLRLLGGTVIKISGNWTDGKTNKEKCFQIKSFNVNQISKGRAAYIGILSKEANDQFVLIDEAGKRYVLEQATKGLKKLQGKRVITDLIISAQANTKQSEQRWKIVSYMEYPSS